MLFVFRQSKPALVYIRGQGLFFDRVVGECCSLKTGHIFLSVR